MHGVHAYVNALFDAFTRVQNDGSFEHEVNGDMTSQKVHASFHYYDINDFIWLKRERCSRISGLWEILVKVQETQANVRLQVQFVEAEPNRQQCQHFRNLRLYSPADQQLVQELHPNRKE